MSSAAESYWKAYLASLPKSHAHRSARFDAFSFGDSAALADELGALVLAGTKRATASLPVEFTSAGLPPPKAGDVSVVTRHDGTPLAIIELTEARRLPFSAADASFAADEGEGDGSLAYWVRAHREYFGRVSARHGLAFDDSTQVLFQRFRVVDRCEFRLRDYQDADADAINELALAAFDELSCAYDNWPEMRRRIGLMSSLAGHAEVIVAERGGALAGTVAYVGPGRPKSTFFRVDWPVMRMLAVHPGARGLGIGRALAAACVERARRDKAPLIALHTSPIMRVALPMYERMGFRWHAEATPVYGVRYGVYVKSLRAESGTFISGDRLEQGI